MYITSIHISSICIYIIYPSNGTVYICMNMHVCACTPLWQTVFNLTFNLFEIKNAGGQEPMIRLSWPTKTRRHGGENVRAFWPVVQAVYFRCFPAFDFRFLRPIRRGREHPYQHWHLTKTFSVIRVFDLSWSHRLLGFDRAKSHDLAFSRIQRGDSFWIPWSRLHFECNTKPSYGQSHRFSIEKTSNRSSHKAKRPFIGSSSLRTKDDISRSRLHLECNASCESPLLPVHAPRLQPRPPPFLARPWMRGA